MKGIPACGGLLLVASPQREQECQLYLCLHQHGECCECRNTRVDEGHRGNGDEGPFKEVRGSQAQSDGVTGRLRELNCGCLGGVFIRDPPVNATVKTRPSSYSRSNSVGVQEMEDCVGSRGHESSRSYMQT